MIYNGRQRRLEKLEFAIWHHESWVLFVYGEQTSLRTMVSLIYPSQRFHFGEEMALDGYRRLCFFFFFLLFIWESFLGYDI